MTAVSAGRAANVVLAARTSPDAAVLVVALRGGHWPYSCGLASTVRRLAPRLSAHGAEVLLLAAETPRAREAIAALWRLPFRWLPEPAVETVARQLGAWDEASARTLDGLGLLGPDGDWILRQDFDDPGGAGSPEAVLTALRGAGLRPLPAPPPAGPALPVSAGTAARRHRGPVASAAERTAVESDRVGVRDPGHVTAVLRRALAAADGLARSLPPSSPAAAKAERTRLRLALYLRAVQDLVPAPGPARDLPG
ncbi:hypothetical protein RKE30_20080 [Streptomyces sp. Li-HN-5-11]|uniref:hypothetical protein n=1 Tax=Streptomyces sp. Li-HN-5-11 TaxID=3075432 RepID=UPI0028A5AE49|nr:hypothetical protein [Streptomyces sp. Li-HN-5-11]WNM32549.1 hypothetical protein RKE30_20080 [Streptomyces sp. Li-HN-5-11]WOP38701.1 hypothetical protein RKE32_35555 [Streptomyces sp. Li-HN-5-13]